MIFERPKKAALNKAACGPKTFYLTNYYFESNLNLFFFVACAPYVLFYQPRIGHIVPWS